MGSGDLYVIVGFRVDRDRSVFYRKCRGEDCLSKSIVKAFLDGGADFVSVRKIGGKTVLRKI